MKPASDYFHQTYIEACNAFREATQANGGILSSYGNHPDQGMHGETLTTNVAYFGPKNPEKIFITTSGTHGVEGYYGSAAQINMIENQLKNLPDDVGVLVIHAINPYGFSHLRRVTGSKENVDLNRNFIFDQGEDSIIPLNLGYKHVAKYLVPEKWAKNDSIRQEADQQLAAYKNTFGAQAYLSAIYKGQYQFPDGINYGGQEPTWSNKTFYQILQDCVPASVNEVAYIDLHTGWDEYGLVAIYTLMEAIHENHLRAKAWYEKTADKIMSSPFPVVGSIANATNEYFSERNVKVTTTAIEVGTVKSPGTTLTALRGDHCLYRYGNGDIHSLEGKAIKEKMREDYCPSDPEWREQVLQKSANIIGATINQLKLTAENKLEVGVGVELRKRKNN